MNRESNQFVQNNRKIFQKSKKDEKMCQKEKASLVKGGPACRKRCAYPLAPSARGLRPQAVGERTVRLPEIFRAMARFSPSAPSGHRPRRGRFFDSLRFFARSAKKSPTVRSRERWGQNAISRPLKRRRAKRQNGGAACYWQEPHRRGKQPVDGSRLVMVSRR